jgi:hypothetical protein
MKNQRDAREASSRQTPTDKGRKTRFWFACPPFESVDQGLQITRVHFLDTEQTTAFVAIAGCQAIDAVCNRLILSGASTLLQPFPLVPPGPNSRVHGNLGWRITRPIATRSAMETERFQDESVGVESATTSLRTGA